MISTPVIGSLNTPTGSTVNRTQNTGKASADFKDLFNPKASESPKEAVGKTAKDISGEDNSRMKKVSEDKLAGRADRSTKVKELRKVSKEDVSDVKEALEQAEEVICEEIGVEPEDIEAALEALGLTQMALLDADKLPQIISVLTGNEDALSLATDETLYEKLSDVTSRIDEILKGLEEKLQVAPGELKEALEKIDDRKVFERPVIMPDPKAEKEAVPENPGLTEDKEQSFEEKIFVTADTSKSRMQASMSTDTQNNATQMNSEEVKPLTTDLKQQKFMGASANDTPAQNSLSFAQNLVEKAMEALNEKVENISYSSIQTQNILNQITEALRVNLSGDTSEVSMRLHPESLGTVSVKVSANHEGVLTAQFTAQNESVKAVIESQAIVLKETLEAKGVTVEAVEVLVQSHEFERNLSKGNEGERNQGEKKHRSLRRIDLSDTSEVSDDSDDTLIREMMERNGNTVDYSA